MLAAGPLFLPNVAEKARVLMTKTPSFFLIFSRGLKFAPFLFVLCALWGSNKN
jgi:hypothetical protein